jgi:hypothetical protein
VSAALKKLPTSGFQSVSCSPLIKRETCGNSENKRIKHHDEHNNTEPGKKLKVPLEDKAPKVSESLQVNFFYE